MSSTRLDRAPEVKTIRRKLAELAAAGKAADLIMALARHHAAARPDALGFHYVDGHARVYQRTRQVQKTHVARLQFPAPAAPQTWVTDVGGDAVFMVVAEPSQSLRGAGSGLPAAGSGLGERRPARPRRPSRTMPADHRAPVGTQGHCDRPASSRPIVPSRLQRQADGPDAGGHLPLTT